MDFVVVLDPSVDDSERSFYARKCCNADVAPLQGLTNASAIPFDCELGTGVKQGVRLSAWSNRMVSRAVQAEPLSVRRSIERGVRVAASRFSTAFSTLSRTCEP